MTMFNKSKVAVVTAIAMASTSVLAAEGQSPIDQLFASVNLSSVVTFVAATGAVIIGIALAVKGISLAKRVINKA